MVIFRVLHSIMIYGHTDTKRIKEYRFMEEKLDKIFDYIKDFVKKNNFPPTVMQIAEDLKYDVEKEVKPSIEKLVAKGKIKFESAKDRIIEIIE